MADPKKLRAEANALVVELLGRLATSDVRELEVKRGGLRVKVSRDGVPTVAIAGEVANDAPAPVTPTPAPALASGLTVKAPLTGIFYRSSSPQMGPFVQIGSVIASGDVIGLIEAMKLFNEIRSTASGMVKSILIENGQLVRAHQPILELEAI